MFYRLYGGDISDSITPGRDLIGTDNYSFDFESVNGSGNDSLNFDSNNTEIKIPYQSISSIGTGDFFLGVWIYMIPNGY